MSKLQALSPSEGEREKERRVRAFGSPPLHQTQPGTRPSFPLSSRCGRRGQGRGGAFPGRWSWLANTGTPLPSPLPFRRGEGEEAPCLCVWLRSVAVHAGDFFSLPKHFPSLGASQHQPADTNYQAERSSPSSLFPLLSSSSSPSPATGLFSFITWARSGRSMNNTATGGLFPSCACIWRMRGYG